MTVQRWYIRCRTRDNTRYAVWVVALSEREAWRAAINVVAAERGLIAVELLDARPLGNLKGRDRRVDVRLEEVLYE